MANGDPNNPGTDASATAPPDPQVFLNDPDFKALPLNEKHNFLMKAMPEYAGLPTKEQSQFLDGVQYGAPTETPGPGVIRTTASRLWQSGVVAPFKKLTDKASWLGTAPDSDIATRWGQETQEAQQSAQQRKEKGRSLPYQVLANAAQASGLVDPRPMEEAAEAGHPRAVLGEALAQAIPYAAPLVFEGMGKVGKGVHDFLEPGRVAEGQARVKDALQTPPGPKGTRAMKMESDIESAKGDLATIFRDTKLKGTDAERFSQAADAIADHKNDLWDNTHTPMVQNHGHLPFDSQAVLNKSLSAIDPLDDSVQADSARDWANREIPKMQTLADADAKIRLLNNDPALKTSAPGAYDAVGKKVRFAALDAARQQLDAHLINDAGEQGLQDQVSVGPNGQRVVTPGVNKRYGALNNIEGQLRMRAEALEKGAATKPSLLPRLLHGYIFEHGGTPTVGAAVNLSRLMAETKAPGRLLKSGLGKIADSRLEAPQVTLGTPTPPGQYPGGFSPTGPNFPQTPGGVTPMQPGPFRGLLPAAGGTTGPMTSAGPGEGISPANPAATSGRISPAAVPLGERTPGPIAGPERQLPAAGTSTGKQLNIETQAPKVGTAPTRPQEMPPSPPTATMSPYFTGKHEFSIFSAENPGSESLSPAQNKIRTAITLRELRSMGYHPQLIEGVENGQGGINSIFVPDMPTHEALNFQDHMQNKFGYSRQSAVITKQGLVDVAKKTATPIDFSKTQFGPDATSKPYHSIANSGQSDAMPFSFTPGDNEVPVKTPYEGEHHSDAVIKSGGKLLGSRRGAVEPGEVPTGAEADRLRKGNGAPGGSYFYDKGALAESQIASRKHTYVYKGEAAIATIEDTPLWADTLKKAYADAKLKGANDTDAHHIAANEAEHALMNAGYDGYRSKAYPGTTFKFGDTQVFKPGEEPPPPELTPHPNAPAPLPSAAEAEKGYKIAPKQPKGKSAQPPNASGESSASLEAINRTASEKAQGVGRFRIDTRTGVATPLIGVDAIDAKPGPWDVIVQRGPKGETLLDRGARANYRRK